MLRRLRGPYLPRTLREDYCYLHDVVHMSLPVVRQLDTEQHQTEPGLEELLVCGGEVVGQLLALQVGQEAARPSVAKEGAEVTAGGGAVVALVVGQGEGEVEVVALRSINTSH